MWRPPDKGRWGALGLGLLAAWFVLLCGWEPFLAILFAAAAHGAGLCALVMLRGGGNLFLLPALALFLGECLGRRRSGGRNG